MSRWSRALLAEVVRPAGILLSTTERGQYTVYVGRHATIVHDAAVLSAGYGMATQSPGGLSLRGSAASKVIAP